MFMLLKYSKVGSMRVFTCSQSGDGFSWILHMASNFLRVAFSDCNRLVRVEGSQLVVQLLRLPGGCRFLVRDFANAVLASYEDEGNSIEISDTTNSRLRKEAIDAITTALFLCPTSELNLHEIIDTVIVPGLKDPRPTVS